jgi:alkylhydroperoxidase family enzyme
MLEDWEHAPIAPKLGATLAFVHKLTMTPEALTPDDARAVLQTGVTEQALRDAIDVATLFATITRIADALAFEVMDDAGNLGSARMLLRFGYE